VLLCYNWFRGEDVEKYDVSKILLNVPEIRDDLNGLIVKNKADKYQLDTATMYNLTYLNQGAMLGIFPFILVAGVYSASYALSLLGVKTLNDMDFTKLNREKYYDEYGVPICFTTIENARKRMQKELRRGR